MGTNTYWNNNIKDGWFLEVNTLMDVLEHVLPPEDNSTVGILGSLPLLLYQEQHRIGPKWETPSDMDVFVSGKPAKEDSVFDAYIEQTIRRMIELYGHVVTPVGDYHTYTRIQGRMVHVKDYMIGGMEMKLSFIQCRDCSNLADVAESFDISVCRVIYQFHSKTLTCSSNVHDDISRSQATVDGIVLSEGLITKRDWVAVIRTMKRMRKYQKRGFSMVNGGAVVFNQIHPQQEPTSAFLPDVHTPLH